MKDLMNQINKDTDELKDMLEWKTYTVTLRDKEGNELIEEVSAYNQIHAAQRMVSDNPDYKEINVKEV